MPHNRLQTPEGEEVKADPANRFQPRSCPSLSFLARA
jgi:hypothetical protein